MKITDHALIRYIERVEQLPLDKLYREKTGRSRKRATDGEIMEFLRVHEVVDADECKKTIAKLITSRRDSVDRNEFFGDLCFVIRDRHLITIVDKDD